MRVYLPATLTSVAAMLASPSREVPAGLAYAVTPQLREWYASGDTEELEYAALTLAAAASLEALRADPAAPRRRTVIAAEADPSDVSAPPPGVDGARGLVYVTSPTPLQRVAAVHVDGDEAVDAVSAALAEPLDADAADDAGAHELLWYATQELEELLHELGS